MRSLRALSVLAMATTGVVVGATPASAQGLQVSGTVTAAPDGAPVRGVIVQLQGTNLSVLTGPTGEYAIDAPSDADTLSFSRLGFVAESVAIANRSVVDVSLRPSPVDLTDLVSVSYGRSAGLRCTGIPDPMPGSAFDPNWQRAHPELARLLVGECAWAAPEDRTP